MSFSGSNRLDEDFEGQNSLQKIRDINFSLLLLIYMLVYFMTLNSSIHEIMRQKRPFLALTRSLRSDNSVHRSPPSKCRSPPVCDFYELLHLLLILCSTFWMSRRWSSEWAEGGAQSGQKVELRMSRRWSSEWAEDGAQNEQKVELRVSRRWSSEWAEGGAQNEQKVELRVSQRWISEWEDMSRRWRVGRSQSEQKVELRMRRYEQKVELRVSWRWISEWDEGGAQSGQLVRIILSEPKILRLVSFGGQGGLKKACQ